MNNQYLTRTELIRRWNRELVDSYFPQCSKELPNPRNKRYPNMQLYDINRIRCIEAMPFFAEKLLKVIENKIKRREAKKLKNKQVNANEKEEID